jgi:putative tryptophan/tyrosine transport system substrate-binding protein
MRRRELIIALSGGALARPLAARAQQPSMPVIGFLITRAPGEDPELLAAFRQGLAETGFVEGQNVAIEYRFGENDYDRLAALAADLVQRRVAAIAGNSPAAQAAKAATTTIPIVFVAGYDPVELGLVANLNRPGGNITGVSNLNVELGPKRLDLLHAVIPTATMIALLVNPALPTRAEANVRDAKVSANALGLRLQVLHASTDGDLDAVFAGFSQLQVGALLIGDDPFFLARSERLGALALRHAVPAAFVSRSFAVAGGLISYGASSMDAFRLVGVYTGRILKGEKPGDLPIQQAAKVELVINLKTAKALGLTVPQSLLGRADEVIE